MADIEMSSTTARVHASAAVRCFRVLSIGVLPALPLALPAQLASTEHALWLSAALYATLAFGTPPTATSAKTIGVLAASLLCSLALVNSGQ